ncbi:MAG: LptA/OstA family protein [Mariprofundaceae bacterium]
MKTKYSRFIIPMLGMCVLMLIGTPAQAQTMTIQSNHLEIWHDKQQALFTGSVHLVRDDFELFCDSLRAFYTSEKDGGGIDHALATGHVRLIQGDKEGRADSAVIDNKKQIVTLKGHAIMQQEGGRIEGDIIVHDMVGKTTEVRQGENGRVRMRIDDASTASKPTTEQQINVQSGDKQPGGEKISREQTDAERIDAEHVAKEQTDVKLPEAVQP